jgi:hypothetical protein
MRDFKKYSNKKLIAELEAINESRKEWLLRAFQKAGQDLKRISGHKLWKDGNHPIELDSTAIQSQKLEYIHMNPVHNEIVEEPEHYVYSSARDYAGIKGALDINLLE